MELNNWQFAQVGKTDWESVTIPTSVHVELLKLGRIPDPFKGLDEWAVQCEAWISRNLTAGVGEADWVFKTTFEVSEEQLKHAHVALVFEGLDTYCEVKLVSCWNDRLIPEWEQHSQRIQHVHHT